MAMLRSVVFLCLLASCLCLTVKLFKPTKRDGPESALLVVPGAHIECSAYLPLAQAIQKQSELSLWVALLEGFEDGLPNPLELPVAIGKAMRGLNAAGYTRGKYFLAGHSLGGVMTQLYAASDSDDIEGVMLFSSYLTRGNALSDFPVPVLTLSGDLDGLTRITRILDTFLEYKNDVETNPEQKYLTPVVTVQGINHGIFASGDMPENVKKYDLEAEVSEDEAHEMIARYATAFMSFARNDSRCNVKSAKTVIDEAFDSTWSLYQPLAEIRSLDQNKERESQWTLTAQKLKLCLKDTSDVEFENEEKTIFKRVTSSVKDECEIESYTTLSLPENLADVSLSPLSPLQLRANMVSQDLAKKMLPDRAFGEGASCKDVNQAAFNMVFAKSSSVAKSRYTNKGKPITFQDDIEYKSKFFWNESDLKLDYSKSGLCVTSTHYCSKVRRIIHHFYGGEDGCTLLSPYRAMEWIYIDSLKPECD